MHSRKITIQMNFHYDDDSMCVTVCARRFPNTTWSLRQAQQCRKLQIKYKLNLLSRTVDKFSTLQFHEAST